MPGQILASIHPGKLLLEEFLKLMHISQYRLDKSLQQVPPQCSNKIIQAKCRISLVSLGRQQLHDGTAG